MEQDKNLEGQVDKTFEEIGDTTESVLNENISQGDGVVVENDETVNNEPVVEPVTESAIETTTNVEKTEGDVSNGDENQEQHEQTNGDELNGDENQEQQLEPDTIDDITRIKDLLKRANYYRYLNCGRHLKNGINKESLEKFYKEFIKQGETATKRDKELIDLLERYLG